MFKKMLEWLYKSLEKVEATKIAKEFKEIFHVSYALTGLEWTDKNCLPKLITGKARSKLLEEIQSEPMWEPNGQEIIGEKKNL